VDGPYWQALFDVLNELVCFGHMSGLLVRVYDRWPLMKSDCLGPYHCGELCGS
jgi:hypothetical protein